MLSDLKLGKFLGAGSFGEVYEGDDPVQGKVAVKLIKANPSQTPDEWREHKENLLKEGQGMAASSHRNVVRVFQALKSPTDDAVLLVMELCQGGCLEAEYKKGPIPIDRVKRITTEVLLGLQAVHNRGMLHRDLKPGNIMLDRDGSAKVSDFGLVTDRLIVGYASQIGYWDHLAIEVYKGGGTSIKSDIWALGMTVYRLLHGHDWYQEDPRPADLIEHGGFAARLRWLPHIPRQWRRFIRKAMHDDTAYRFQSTSEMLDALATLPDKPAWQCSVTGPLIRWARTQDKKELIAELDRSNPKAISWRAFSINTRNGKQRRMGGSGNLKDLEAFFAKGY